MCIFSLVFRSKTNESETSEESSDDSTTNDDSVKNLNVRKNINKGRWSKQEVPFAYYLLSRTVMMLKQQLICMYLSEFMFYEAFSVFELHSVWLFDYDIFFRRSYRGDRISLRLGVKLFYLLSIPETLTFRGLQWMHSPLIYYTRTTFGVGRETSLPRRRRRVNDAHCDGDEKLTF